jgi:hypothetical protein
MQDLAGIRLADIPKRFPNWLVAADRMANELLGRQDWLMRRGSGDSWLDQTHLQGLVPGPPRGGPSGDDPETDRHGRRRGVSPRAPTRQRQDASGR